jgi:hypothetical protein
MIHRLLHPAVLYHLLPWLEEVCEHLGLDISASPYIADLCGKAHTQVLLGVEEERPVALLVTQLPTPLMLYPTILLGYNTGSKPLGAEMMHTAAQWLRAEGFDCFLATNRSGRSDAAYERGFRPHGRVIERVTTLLVELNKEEETDEVRSRDWDLGVRAA